MSYRVLFLLLLGCLLLSGCTESTSIQSHRPLRLAVTTSTRDSGLLDVIVPAFEAASSTRVDVLAVGTGAALKLGESGDVDAILCHAEDRELQFLGEGHAVRREPIMANSFVILGPEKDPAEIKGSEPWEAFQKILADDYALVSRGDQSGTHLRERAIFENAVRRSSEDLLERGKIETGQGMGSSLVIADEKQAYILADRGTYLKFKSKISLVPLVEDGKQLDNPYGLLVINPAKDDQINAPLANRFADFLISREIQQAIGEYHVAGEALFIPSRL